MKPVKYRFVYNCLCQAFPQQKRSHIMNEKNRQIIEKLRKDNEHYSEFNKTNQQYWKGMTIIGLVGAALLILLMRL